MFFYIVFAPISITSGLRSTGNTRRYQQIDVYINQSEDVAAELQRLWASMSSLNDGKYVEDIYMFELNTK